jgi:hypothetical protein
MKKIIMTFLLSGLVIYSSYSQAALIVLILGDKVATEQFHLSVDAAANLATYPGLDGSKIGAGVNFGLGTHIKLGEKWHLKPEFKPLSHKGTRGVASITEVPAELTVENNKLKLYYIDIPVFLQYSVNDNLYLSAGPQVSFLTNAYQYSSGTLADGTESTIRIKTKSAFKSVSFSCPVEAGFSLHLANDRSTTSMDINIFVRYEYGFTDVFNDPALGSSNISMFQVGASLPFVKTAEELAKSKK